MNNFLENLLLGLNPNGVDGFEGLIAQLLQSLTGRQFHVARSGSQGGRDISTRSRNANIIAVECKRYKGDTTLPIRDLQGTIVQAKQGIPDLDLWILVASRSVDSQLHEALTQTALDYGINYLAISSADGELSTLEALLAQNPEIVIKFFDEEHSAGLKDTLALIATHPLFPQILQNLIDEFTTRLLGYENWRVNQNSFLCEQFSSENRSRASFGQSINVMDDSVRYIDRILLQTSLDNWFENWSDAREPAVVLGAQGDGKTWSVASWLSQKIQTDSAFPPVVFFTSLTATSSDPFALIIDEIAQRDNKQHWEKRINRWTEGVPFSQPSLVVVLDGINERRSFLFWRELVERICVEPWSGHVALILTCRTEYWNRYETQIQVPLATIQISPYNDNELAQALAHHSLSLADIQANLLLLIQKPRYFDLMIRHRHAMAISGDFTHTRLIYEDWRDRLGRKRNELLDHETFQDVIKDLAFKQQGILRERDVRGVSPRISDEVFEELRTGGVLHGTGDRYRVNKDLLKYGLGLLLIEQVISDGANNNEDIAEAISAWLEPYGEMDLKAAICGFAALHALTIQTTLNVRIALLNVWVGSLNPDAHIKDDFVAYFPLDPSSYFELSEIIWSDSHENPWAQELLIETFLRWKETPEILPRLQATFERWLGFVHLLGSPHERVQTAKEAATQRQRINERLGFELALGPFQFGGYTLTGTEDAGLLRLGMAALSVISHLPRGPFVPALTIASLADAVMNSPDKYDLLSWIIRTSQESVWTQIYTEVLRLQELNDRVINQAAYRLLSFEGSEEAQRLQASFPEDLFPVHPLQELWGNDPCVSYSQWSEEICEECLHRTDLETQWIARQIKTLSTCPNFIAPNDLGARLEPLLESLDKNALWSTFGPSSEDHNYQEYEAALCAYAPRETADFIRGVVQKTHERTGMALRQISHKLDEHYLLFDANELESVHQAWQQFIERTEAWTDDARFIESWLFPHTIKHLAGQEQLRLLIGRPDDCHDLTGFEDHFLPPADWQDIREVFLEYEHDIILLRRLLWFLSASANIIPEDIVEQEIYSYISHENSLIRRTALKIVYLSGNTSAIQSVIDCDWAWNSEKYSDENHWGSILLAEFGTSIPYEELRTRIHPSYLGYAVKCRGMNTDEIAEFAKDIHAIWSILGEGVPELPGDLPSAEIIPDSQDGSPLGRDWLIISSSLFSQSITFRSRYASWGGILENDFQRVANFMNRQAWDNKYEEARKAFELARIQQIEAGNHWFGRQFYPDALDEVIQESPELASQWIDAIFDESRQSIRRVHLASSFYQCLCMRLFQTDPEQGQKVYWGLKKRGSGIVVIGETGIAKIDYALFKAPVTHNIQNAWLKKLDECESDADLLKIAMLAQSGNGSEWLWSIIENGIASEVPLDRARASTLVGFYEGEQAISLIEQTMEREIGTWHRKLLESSQQLWQSNSWAKEWYSRCFSEESNDLAWRSFRLFLHCVDSRFWFWRDQFGTEQAGQSNTRTLFIEDNHDTIKNRIKKNEEPLNRNFLGQKLLQGQQVWPWTR